MKSKHQNKVEFKKEVDILSTKWGVKYQQLKKYYEQHQHCNVPRQYEYNPSLGVWVNIQRQSYKKNKLSQERIDLLNQLNFNWDGVEEKWREMYQQLKEYYGQYQNCNVPTRYKENPRLGQWVNVQRQAYKNNKLSQERMDLLEKLNFSWDRAEGKWEEMYQQLKEYYNQYQDCDINERYPENYSLWIWINKQRRDYKNNKLSQEKIGLLEKINFSWDVKETRWEEMYQQLKEYYEQHQDCNIPHQYEQNPQLGNWVFTQRTAYKKNELSQDKIHLLNQLDFHWGVKLGDQWIKRYHQLKEYYGQYQNCNVPTNYKVNPSLGMWVSTQRRVYKKNKMLQERIDLLNQLNFDWRN